ncbi:uncharacterized protein LOC135464798 [Liolophura sinensis]|uniref:uncharacterized protein LOC135464798 n=1 Tax=Liolophura sinensis TaxID=3198878 RepID=UPI003158FC16
MPAQYTEEKEADSDVLELTEAVTPEILPKWRVLLLNLSWYGVSLMLLVMSVEVIPSQMRVLVGERYKGRWLGGLVAAGAVITFFLSPIIGMKSDRLQSRYGRRRPVMITATFFLCIGLIGMAFSAPELEIPLDPEVVETNNITGTCEVDLVHVRCSAYNNASLPHILEQENGVAVQGTIKLPEKKVQNPEMDVNTPSSKGSLGLYVVFYLVVTSAFASVTVPYNALIADKSHPSQRGFNSGVMGAMILLGNLSGAGIGICLMKIGIFSTYGCMIGVILLCILITCLTTSETPGKNPGEPLGFGTIFCGFWQPLTDHDFRWVFLTRFLMQQGVSTVTAFLEYWLSDMVNLPNCWTPQTSVGLLLIPLLSAAAICSVLCGILSDRLGRRKPLVITSALLMCGTSCVLAFIRGSYAYYIAFVMSFFFGLGFGSFQSVDFAIVMDILPAERDKAKDIAVWHQALVLPQALATPIGGMVLDIFEHVNCEIGLGYIILFLMTSSYFFLSGAFVLKIRGVR